MDLPSLRRETRYGMPAADQIMFNRHYVLGYSYYFRQAKWALEIVSSETTPLNEIEDRLDNFRPDYRVPDMFRADLIDYKKSGYDRGHLVASANKKETKLQNSETFLLSNMSPQHPDCNRRLWKDLEASIRDLDTKKNIFETYVICGPIFDFLKLVEVIGSEDKNGVSIPIPHSFFKSVLTENHRGSLNMYSFVIPNEKTNKKLEELMKPVTYVEKMSGIKLWDRLVGKKIEKEKSKTRKMWK